MELGSGLMVRRLMHITNEHSHTHTHTHTHTDSLSHPQYQMDEMASSFFVIIFERLFGHALSGAIKPPHLKLKSQRINNLRLVIKELDKVWVGVKVLEVRLRLDCRGKLRARVHKIVGQK